jgi:hypothetical protein
MKMRRRGVRKIMRGIRRRSGNSRKRTKVVIKGKLCGGKRRLQKRRR